MTNDELRILNWRDLTSNNFRIAIVIRNSFTFSEKMLVWISYLDCDDTTDFIDAHGW